MQSAGERKLCDEVLYRMDMRTITQGEEASLYLLLSRPHACETLSQMLRRWLARGCVHMFMDRNSRPKCMQHSDWYLM
jgi:hypothetical protein